MMAFMGVRISWLMLDRNSCFAALACSASFRACSAAFRAASISALMRVSSDTWFRNSFKYRKNMYRSIAIIAKEAA